MSKWISVCVGYVVSVILIILLFPALVVIALCLAFGEFVADRVNRHITK